MNDTEAQENLQEAVSSYSHSYNHWLQKSTSQYLFFEISKSWLIILHVAYQ